MRSRHFVFAFTAALFATSAAAAQRPARTGQPKQAEDPRYAQTEKPRHPMAEQLNRVEAFFRETLGREYREG